MHLHPRTLPALAALCLCGVAARSIAQDHPVSRSIEPITAHVYRALNNNYRTVFMVTDEGIILADPLNIGFAEWFKAEAARRFKVPVKFVVYSHHHDDHASGGAVFADTAQFVGHANMLSYLALPPASTRLADIVGEYAVIAALDIDGSGFVERDESGGTLSEYEFAGYDADGDSRLSGPEVARGPLSHVQPPNVTFTDQLELTLGGRRLKLQWVGRTSHGADTSLITYPDDSVMFVVDYVDVGRLPHRDMRYEYGLLDEWMVAVRDAERLAAGFRYVTAGHGPLGTAADVTAWRRYLEELRAEVGAGIERGQTLESLLSSIRMEKYAGWLGYHWVDQNVFGMYHHLTSNRRPVAPLPPSVRMEPTSRP